MKRVLWFSKFEMTMEQMDALGEIEIKQISRSINTAYELQKEIAEADIIAIVAPIGLQQQFLKLAGNKPVIMAVYNRFHFVKWVRLLKIEVVKEDYIP